MSRVSSKTPIESTRGSTPGSRKSEVRSSRSHIGYPTSCISHALASAITSSTSSNVSARTVSPSGSATDRPSGTLYRRHRSRRRPSTSSERARRRSRSTARTGRRRAGNIDQLALRERHVGVDRPVSIRLPVADEPDGTVRLPVAEHRVHLARPAPDADLVAVHEPHAARSAVAPHTCSFEKTVNVAEAGRLEDRPDVEAEAVRDERERDAVRVAPLDEGRERGIEHSARRRTRSARRRSPVSNASCAWIASRSPISPASTASSYRATTGRRTPSAGAPRRRSTPSRRSRRARRDREHRGRLPARLRPWTMAKDVGERIALGFAAAER